MHVITTNNCSYYVVTTGIVRDFLLRCVFMKYHHLHFASLLSSLLFTLLLHHLSCFLRLPSTIIDGSPPLSLPLPVFLTPCLIVVSSMYGLLRALLILSLTFKKVEPIVKGGKGISVASAGSCGTNA